MWYNKRLKSHISRRLTISVAVVNRRFSTTTSKQNRKTLNKIGNKQNRETIRTLPDKFTHEKIVHKNRLCKKSEIKFSDLSSDYPCATPTICNSHNRNNTCSNELSGAHTQPDHCRLLISFQLDFIAVGWLEQTVVWYFFYHFARLYRFALCFPLFVVISLASTNYTTANWPRHTFEAIDHQPSRIDDSIIPDLNREHRVSRIN